jgi:hypothetical protein
MSDPTQNRPRSSPPGLRAQRRVLRPDHDVAAQRSALAAVRAAFERSGLDVEYLDEQRRRSRARLEAALGRFRAGSDEDAPAMAQAVARSAQNWLEAQRLRSTLAAAGIYSLTTADAIVADPGIDLQGENIGPWANTAEVVFSEQTSDVNNFNGEVSFVFSWPNPTGQDVLCNVTGLFGITATAVATADSYWWPLYPTAPFSEIAALAGLELTVVDTEGQVTVPPFQASQAQSVVDLVVNGDWAEGTIIGQDIFRCYVLQYENLLLPADAKLQADLRCEIGWVASDGAGYFDAAANGRNLSGFGVVIDTQPRGVFAPPTHV